MPETLLSSWSLNDGVIGLGNASLLDLPLTAFFASRQCSGRAIRAAMEWALEHARHKRPIIGGFHSPLEQSVLKVMLTAAAPCVIVLARSYDQRRLSADWLMAARNGTAAVVSVENTTRRLTAELAAKRNEWIARQAARILVAPSEDGLLQQQSEKWIDTGFDVEYLPDKEA